MKNRYLFLSLTFALVFISCEKDNTDYSVSLDRSIVELKIGQTITLEAKSAVGVTWSSDNEQVAKVFYGVVTCVGEGQATIKASTTKSSASCIVIGKSATSNDDTPNIEIPTEHGEYKLVWSDEFDGNELNAQNWNIEKGNGNWGWGNGELEYYTDREENLRVKDGYLEIEARKELYGGFNYTSARIQTKNKVDFTYGRCEARICLPSGRGTWPAFWTLGYSSWPRGGEIDIMEHIGSNPYMISHAVHTVYQNGSNGNNWYAQWYANSSNPVEGEFHVYAIEWKKNYDFGKDYIFFFVDDERTGVIVQSNTEENRDIWPFIDKQYIILNMAIGGNMGGNVDDNIFNDQATNPIVMKVDYVRVYQKAIY